MLLFLLFVLLFLSPLPLTLSLNQDGLLLLRAKQQLSDPQNSLATWNDADTTPCRWRGITCDPITGAVLAVNLSSSRLSGPFPGFLCSLPSLSFLSLSNNLINSTLPAVEFAGCRSLRHLNLSRNSLVGPIPDTLSQIPSLRHLDLASNNLSGDIPASLGQLRQLESLILVYNFLNGTIPSSLGNISTLKKLHLAYNPYTPSPIPSELSNLTNLEVLQLTQCNLVGPIPTSLGNLARLTSLDLSQNMLNGTIPESFAGLKSVTQIELYDNSLSGELPTGMSNLTRLELFDSSTNKLTGTIPPELCELNLASLSLFENRLEGPVPVSIARSPNLYELLLYNNNFVGPLPSDLGSNSPLRGIDVSYNQFSGEIPANLCRQGHFYALLMIHNSFSGKIPDSFGNCKSLARVRLRNNKFSGVVPDAFWGLPRVYLLDLIDNSFTGHISKAISVASNLSSLLLSNNQFSGSIPDEIGLLDGLVEFSASHNNLSGQIPTSMFKLSQLNSLDLSYNQLSGELVGGITNWTKLSNLNLANNSLDGSIPSELGSLPVLSNLDLSCNNFSGEIPPQLQNLKLYKFNLSNNKLSGDIPPVFANDRYRMSFVGNPGLCGHLSEFCPRSYESKKRGSVWIFRSIFVLIGVVFIFAVTCFYSKYKKVKKLKRGVNIWKTFHKLRFSEFEIVKLLNEDNVIGSGASGKVYKVVLSNGEVVAVKKLWGASENVNENVRSGKDEFEVEVETLGKIRHKNIVRLWCCCNSGDNKFLVYEYMPNGSLADLLKNNRKRLLDWPTRYKIAIDAAEGLSYLHHDCVPPIIHRDVKSNNILLDGEFLAKVSDFGVAKIVTGVRKGGQSMSVIAGSFGYIAPEYAYTIRVNEKTDVYSFGVVILELVTGKPPVDAEYGENDLVKWVSSTLEQNGLDRVIDPTLDSKYKEEINKVLSVGLQCTSSLPITRPAMRSVVKMLQDVETVSKSKSVKDGEVSYK